MAKQSDEEVIECADAREWERWLRNHRRTATGVWLRIAKQGAGGLSISISDALDVALCYGWIDSQRKGLDASYYLQRYSPRRPASPWSSLNVERAEALIAAGRMKPAGLREIEAAQQDGRWAVAYEAQRDFQVPLDFQAALAANMRANQAFSKLGKSGQYGIVLPILKATTLARRATRIRQVIAKLEAISSPAKKPPKPQL